MNDNGKRTFNAILLRLTVFVCGMIVLVLEVLGSRLLGPYFGISLFIWSSLIAITLVSLSIGYWAGGILSDRYQSRSFFYSLILAAGFLVLLIPLAQKPVSLAMTDLGPRAGCLASAFILFSGPLTLLGTVAPFSLKLSLREIRHAGKISGDLYALSTAGGILGTLLVGFWLIPSFGLTNILLLIASTLAFLPLLYFTAEKAWPGAAASVLGIVAPILLFGFYHEQPRSAAIIYKSESFYGQLKVLGTSDRKFLMVDGTIQTMFHPASPRSTATYTGLVEEAIQAFREENGGKPLRGAVIGLGGGIIPEAEKRAGDEVDIVEIDPRMSEVARDFFNFEPGQFHIFLEDARPFLNRGGQKYDYIVLDVFAGDSAPFYLLSRECFEQIKRHLSGQGILIMNTAGMFAGEGSEFTHSVYRTLRDSFPDVTVLSTSRTANFSNYIMVAGTGSTAFLARRSSALKDQEFHLDKEKGLVLTDNFNPADFLWQNVALSWRRSIWKETPPEILLD